MVNYNTQVKWLFYKRSIVLTESPAVTAGLFYFRKWNTDDTDGMDKTGFYILRSSIIRLYPMSGLVF